MEVSFINKRCAEHYCTDTIPRYNSHFAGYGLGWFLTDVKGNLLVSHRGTDPGMVSKISLIPDLNMGVVILTNTFPGGRPLCSAIGGTIYLGLVGGTIIDSYLGLDDFGWTDRIYDKFQKSRNKADSVTIQFWKKVKAVNDKHINVEDYTGIYGNKWFGKVEVHMNENQLWFKSYRSPKLNGPMKYYKANAFAIKWEYQDWNMDAFAIFNLDEEGKAQSIRMKGISPKSDFPDLDLQRI